METNKLSKSRQDLVDSLCELLKEDCYDSWQAKFHFNIIDVYTLSNVVYRFKNDVIWIEREWDIFLNKWKPSFMVTIPFTGCFSSSISQEHFDLTMEDNVNLIPICGLLDNLYVHFKASGVENKKRAKEMCIRDELLQYKLEYLKSIKKNTA